MNLIKPIFTIALIHVTIKLGIYLIDTKAFAVESYDTYRILLLLVMVIFTLYQLKSYDKNVSFKSIFTFVFGVFILASFLGFLTDVFIFSFLKDSNVIDIKVDNEYQASVAELEYMNATNNIDKDEIRTNILNNISILGLLKSLLISIPFSLVASIILALLFYPKRSYS